MHGAVLGPKHRREQIQYLEQELMRLEYAAKRAERQYNCVDPENRLIAATLEKNWEQALVELEQAKAKPAEVRDVPRSQAKIPAELRESFTDIGHRLPELWPRLRYSQTEKEIAERLRQLTEQGQNVAQIIATLNAEGRVPCRGGSFTRQIVMKLEQRHGIVSPIEQLRRGVVPAAYTIKDMARKLKVDPSWFSRKIAEGAIRITKDAKYQSRSTWGGWANRSTGALRVSRCTARLYPISTQAFTAKERFQQGQRKGRQLDLRHQTSPGNFPELGLWKLLGPEDTPARDGATVGTEQL